MSKQNTVVVDEHDTVLGDAPIEQAHREGLWHRVSVIYVWNNSGEILLQERADGGGFDHSAAGHVDVGESYLEAAERELKEELGVSGVALVEVGDAEADEPKPHVQKHLRHKFKIFECIAEPGILEPTEVLSVVWADPRAVWEEMQIGTGRKYTGGFKKTLEVVLKKKGLL